MSDSGSSEAFFWSEMTSSRLRNGSGVSGFLSSPRMIFSWTERLGRDMGMESRKRSSWGSGRGNVPVLEVSFWVAMTMNGSASVWVDPSMVTWDSFIASRSADWTRGEVLLISSASSRLVKTGPWMKSKSPLCWR